MEHPDYRLNLERLDAYYPGREILSRTEAAKILGLDKRTVSKHYKLKSDGTISKASLARQMCR